MTQQLVLSQASKFDLADQRDAKVIQYYCQHREFNNDDPDHIPLFHAPGVPTTRGATELYKLLRFKMVGSKVERVNGHFCATMHIRSFHQTIDLEFLNIPVQIKITESVRTGAGQHIIEEVALGFAYRNAVRHLLPGATFDH